MSPASEDRRGVDWGHLGYHARGALAVVIALGVLVGGGWFVYSEANQWWTDWRTADDYIGEGEEEVSVLIPQGASVTQIGDILVEHDVIRSRDTFRSVASDHPDAGNISYGRYLLKTQIPAAMALDMLLDPANREILRVRLIEGLTMSQQFERINEQLGVPIEDLEAAATPDNLPVPEWAGDNIEGLLFPSTYDVSEPVNPTQILTRQVEQFNREADRVDLESRASELGRTPHEVLTIASIIEREVNQAEYRSMVSAVIYNRLEEGMALEMDSTVHYAVGRFDTVTTTAEERQVDSPYNTYRYPGVPPGPISNPGRAALEAAVDPADIDALFFVTVNLDTGETLFARTNEEHEENRAQFIQWCSDNPGRC